MNYNLISNELSINVYIFDEKNYQISNICTSYQVLAENWDTDLQKILKVILPEIERKTFKVKRDGS